MRSPGKFDHPARWLDGKAGIDFGDDLLGRIAIVGIVDHGLRRDARAPSCLDHIRDAPHAGVDVERRVLPPIDVGTTPGCSASTVTSSAA